MSANNDYPIFRCNDGASFTLTDSPACNQVNYANGKISFVTGSGGNLIINGSASTTFNESATVGSWTASGTSGNLITGCGVFTTEGKTEMVTSPSSPTGNVDMPASFVSDNFVSTKASTTTETVSAASPNYETYRSIIEAQANEIRKLDQQINHLSSDVNYDNSLDNVRTKEISYLLKQKTFLEEACQNQGQTIQKQQDKLQKLERNLENVSFSFIELQEAHDALRATINDMDPACIDDTLSDYQAQIAYYEGVVREYEAAKLHPASNIYIKEDIANGDHPLTQWNYDPISDEVLSTKSSELSHEDKIKRLEPGQKIWLLSTSKGPFITIAEAVSKHSFNDTAHCEKGEIRANAWIVRDSKGKDHTAPVGDITFQPTMSKKISAIRLGLINATATAGPTYLAYTTLGAKAAICMAVAQMVFMLLQAKEFSKVI